MAAGVSYGSTSMGGSVFLPGKRRRMNAVAVCINLLLPWFTFSFLYGVLSFWPHYKHATLAWCTVALGYVGVAIAAFLAYRTKRRDRDPTWYQVCAMLLGIAVAAATFFGDANFWYNMQPFYDIVNLNTYPSVDPSQSNGQMLMDAGQVYFSDGTTLDMQKSMAFSNGDLYCVTPIKNGDGQMQYYDFWAIGINCCSPVSSDFRCGEFNNPHARSGLRLMNDEQRSNFRLAVQMAEAAYRIESPHPLFFYWMQNPWAEISSYLGDGYKYYALGVVTFFAFNLFAVICALVTFSKIGRK